jgi:hypothetical protein
LKRIFLTYVGINFQRYELGGDFKNYVPRSPLSGHARVVAPLSLMVQLIAMPFKRPGHKTRHWGFAFTKRCYIMDDYG